MKDLGIGITLLLEKVRGFKREDEKHTNFLELERKVHYLIHETRKKFREEEKGIFNHEHGERRAAVVAFHSGKKREKSLDYKKKERFK